jgi:hypothetical protein
MSNDRLPSPDLPVEPVSDAGAAVVPADDAGGQRNRGVFTEYKAIGASPDTNATRALLQTIARLEAVVRDAPSRVTAGLMRGLAEFAATIKQIESMLPANEAPAQDVHFALEHMQDIAMALRLRDVEAALCDTLDAAIREVGDAIVRNDAAAARSQSAAALLRELAGQIDQMIAIGDDIVGVGATERIDSPAAATAGRFDDTAYQPLADSVVVRDSDEQQELLPQPVPSVAVLPDKQAKSGPSEERPILCEPVSSSLSRAPPIIGEEAAPAVDQASARPVDETSASILAASAADADATEAGPRTTSISAQPLLDIGTDATRDATRAVRATANGPLAALNALSDEEIIALFS